MQATMGHVFIKQNKETTTKISNEKINEITNKVKLVLVFLFVCYTRVCVNKIHFSKKKSFQKRAQKGTKNQQRRASRVCVYVYMCASE